MIPDIATLCGQISNFIGYRDWRTKANPVICMEFDSASDYFHARGDLAHELISSLNAMVGIPATHEQIERVIGPDTCELDYYGVTFRLTCKQRIDTPHGDCGVTEVQLRQVETMPDGFWSGLQTLRKNSGY